MQESRKPQRYAPDWEPVAKAVQRVAGYGLEEDDVKSDLCSAIADRKIKLRLRVARGGRLVSRDNVLSLAHIQPSDIDWRNSRPVAKWWIGPSAGQHYAWLNDE